MAKGRALTGEEPGERKRRRLLDAAAASVTTVDAEALAFQHSIFCQTGLPSYFEFTVDAVTGIIAYSAVCNMLELVWEWRYYFAAILRSISLVMAR
jgi:hypothetical protein